MKKISGLFLVVIFSICSVLVFTSCQNSVNDTYYLEKTNGTLDNSSWISLKDNIWTDDAGETGEYKINGKSIILYQDSEELFTGTIENGVLTIDASSVGTLVYRKEAAKQDDENIGNDEVDEAASVKTITGGTVEGLNVNLEVSQTVINVDLSGMITVSSGSSWQLYADITGQKIIPTKYAANLKNGDNTYYIVVNSSDGKVNRTYTLNIYKIHYVTITYMSAGKVYDTQQILTHTTLDEGPAIIRSGYTFGGWECSGHYVTQSKTFTANWINNTYTLTLNANGGSVSQNSKTVTFGSIYSLSIPSRMGYTFIGWKSDGIMITGADGDCMGVWSIAGNRTAYAQWSQWSPYARVGDYVWFGEYPQTIKEDSVIVGSTADNDGYFLGSDGARYAKVIASPNESDYTFSNDATVTSGTTYYFKVKPIKWRILEESDGTAFILAELILDNHRYNESYNGKQNGVYANNYKESEIRAWLNDQFYNTAFNTLQQAIILTTNVDNSLVSTGDTNNPFVCANTNDKVFLLSYAEATNTSYGFSSSAYSAYAHIFRERKTSDYSRSKGVWTSTTTGNGWWWLRSPNGGNMYNDTLNVSYNGNILGRNVCSTYYGVVPALKIQL